MNSLTCLNETPPDVADEYVRYKIGQTISEYNPAEEKYKFMLRLVAYDVREPKRLRKVAKVCEDFGIRVEYSVFECDLSEILFSRLWMQLQKIIDPGEDCILAYRICGACVSGIDSMGAIVRPGKPLLYII